MKRELKYVACAVAISALFTACAPKEEMTQAEKQVVCPAGWSEESDRARVDELGQKLNDAQKINGDDKEIRIAEVADGLKEVIACRKKNDADNIKTIPNGYLAYYLLGKIQSWKAETRDEGIKNLSKSLGFAAADSDETNDYEVDLALGNAYLWKALDIAATESIQAKKMLKKARKYFLAVEVYETSLPDNRRDQDRLGRAKSGIEKADDKFAELEKPAAAPAETK